MMQYVVIFFLLDTEVSDQNSNQRIATVCIPYYASFDPFCEESCGSQIDMAKK